MESKDRRSVSNAQDDKGDGGPRDESRRRLVRRHWWWRDVRHCARSSGLILKRAVLGELHEEGFERGPRNERKRTSS